jgi:Protein of unknown function (DUF4079)
MNSETLSSLKPYLSFFHPIMMWILLVITIYAMYLGVQVRRTRLAEGDVKKEMIKGKFAIRHHQIGSIVLAIMVLGAIGGIVMTYITRVKIYINAHLFAGLGMVGAIAVSASLVPFMQKHDWVRRVHVGINMVVMGLFGWQAFTGVQIVQKILSSMNTPAAG